VNVSEEKHVNAIDALRDRIPEPARDISVNLQSALAQGSLSEAQRWGIALAVSTLPRYSFRSRA